MTDINNIILYFFMFYTWFGMCAYLFSLCCVAGLRVQSEEKEIVVALGNSTYLECLPKSHHATVTWFKQIGENSLELYQVHTHTHTWIQCIKLANCWLDDTVCSKKFLGLIPRLSDLDSFCAHVLPMSANVPYIVSGFFFEFKDMNVMWIGDYKFSTTVNVNVMCV